jgi:hypothetical protein
MLDLVGLQYESVVDCGEHDNKPFEFRSRRRISWSAKAISASQEGSFPKLRSALRWKGHFVFLLKIYFPIHIFGVLETTERRSVSGTVKIKRKYKQDSV